MKSSAEKHALGRPLSCGRRLYLSDSMAEYPHIFDQLFRAMVAAGEKSGHLDTVLNRLADYTENRQQMRSKLQQAMIYPTMLTLVAVSVVAFLLATVVPKIVDQFVQMGQKLPTITEVLLAASNFVQNWGLVVIIAIVSMIMLLKAALKKTGLSSALGSLGDGAAGDRQSCPWTEYIAFCPYPFYLYIQCYPVA